MNFIGTIKKDGGDMRDLPIEVRQKVYDFISGIDLAADDAMREEGKYGMYSDDDVPGLHAVVASDKIVVILKMGVYDLESKSINDEIVMSVGIPRNDIAALIKEKNYGI